MTVFLQNRALPPSEGGLSRWIMTAVKQTSKQASLSQPSHRLLPPAIPPTVKNSFTVKKKKAAYAIDISVCINVYVV